MSQEIRLRHLQTSMLAEATALCFIRIFLIHKILPPEGYFYNKGSEGVIARVKQRLSTLLTFCISTKLGHQNKIFKRSGTSARPVVIMVFVSIWWTRRVTARVNQRPCIDEL